MDGRKRKVLDWKKSKRLTSGALLAFVCFNADLDKYRRISNCFWSDCNKYFEIQLSIKLLSRDI